MLIYKKLYLRYKINFVFLFSLMLLLFSNKKVEANAYINVKDSSQYKLIDYQYKRYTNGNVTTLGTTLIYYLGESLVPKGFTAKNLLKDIRHVKKVKGIGKVKYKIRQNVVVYRVKQFFNICIIFSFFIIFIPIFIIFFKLNVWLWIAFCIILSILTILLALILFLFDIINPRYKYMQKLMDIVDKYNDIVSKKQP